MTDPGSDLGEFLRSRRARVRPEDVGLTTYGGRRRVPGLRREELAHLAGISATYYTRLEQGHIGNVSDQVLGALARVLRLDEAERDHLETLARNGSSPLRTRRVPRTEHVRPGLRFLLASIVDVPALVTTHRSDILAWNPLGHAIFGRGTTFDAPDTPARRPNLIRSIFLDPLSRELYPHWQDKAVRAVSALRFAAGRHPDDRQLTDLVGELVVKSPEFAVLWSGHSVKDCSFGDRDIHHPDVGTMHLHEETLPLPDDAGQRFSVFSPEPGSSSADSLHLLACLVATRAHAL